MLIFTPKPAKTEVGCVATVCFTLPQKVSHVRVASLLAGSLKELFLGLGHGTWGLGFSQKGGSHEEEWWCTGKPLCAVQVCTVKVNFGVGLFGVPLI